MATGCARASLGSLSESVAVFEPERLKRVASELGGKLKPIAKDPRLKDLKRALTLADGSVLKVLPWLSQAMLQEPADERKVRLHAHFEVDRCVPIRIDVTGGTPRGGDDERAVMLRSIEPDHLYVMDRGQAKFTLFNAIVADKSSYVCRIRDNSAYGAIESRPLAEEDLDADLAKDEIVRIGMALKEDARPDHPLRMVTIKTTPHEKRGVNAGPGSDGYLRLGTTLTGRPGVGGWADIPLSLDHRGILQVLQACAWMSSPSEHAEGGHRNSSLHGDHCLHADQPAHRPQADAANLRDDLSSLRWSC